MNLRGNISYDEPMAKHTSWRVGGPARQFYQPVDAGDLAAFIAGLPKNEPILWLGLGSNLLVRDGGFNGTVIAMQGRLAEIQLIETKAHVGAGAACAKVARSCARAGLGGAGFLAGIPGTMGGALAMNAGAFGGETWQIVRQVTTLDRAGRLHRRTPSEYHIAYRQVSGPADESFIGCILDLTPSNAAQEQEAIRALLEKRSIIQPTGKPSGGSTFKNPPGDHAARLIEASGLKGCRIGGAEVSPKHANFIINADEASALDIERLIEHLQAEVERQQGIRLQTEVCIIGETR